MKKTKHDNVMMDGRRIVTLNKIPEISVYGERLFQENGSEYRVWDPRRSKLCAALTKGADIPKMKSSDVWLYLGAASGTTVSHVSDIVTNGMVFGIEFSPRVLRELYFLSEKRKNISPILADANKLDEYKSLVCSADVVFQDVAQKNQVDIFIKNVNAFMKDDGFAIFSCKSRSIDVSKKPKEVFKMVERKLKESLKIIDWRTLDPFEMDHAIFICKKNK